MDSFYVQEVYVHEYIIVFTRVSPDFSSNNDFNGISNQVPSYFLETLVGKQ